jgi:hypothetical protein
MFVSQLLPLPNHPHVRDFFKQVLDGHFYDVRAMLRLPLPAAGIDTGCNLALSGTLCNILSGISTTIYKPAHLLHEVQSKYGSGAAFQDLVRGFFPHTPPGAVDFPKQLYDYARNPLAHALAFDQSNVWQVKFGRVYHHTHPDSGWTDEELKDLESGRFRINLPSVVITGQTWTMNCDSFYFDVIELLRRLAVDAAQMQAAESRFQQGVYNWRR